MIQGKKAWDRSELWSLAAEMPIPIKIDSSRASRTCAAFNRAAFFIQKTAYSCIG